VIKQDMLKCVLFCVGIKIIIIRGKGRKPVPYNRVWPASQRESHTKGHLIHKGI